MLCWEASISLPGKHPSRLKWQAKACKNLLLTSFSQARSKSPGGSPSPGGTVPHCCLAELSQLNSGAGEGDRASASGAEEIRSGLTALGPCSQFPARSQASFHGLFSGKKRDRLPGSHQEELLGDGAGGWYRQCPVGHGRAQLWGKTLH